MQLVPTVVALALSPRDRLWVLLTNRPASTTQASSGSSRLRAVTHSLCRVRWSRCVARAHSRKRFTACGS